MVLVSLFRCASARLVMNCDVVAGGVDVGAEVEVERESVWFVDFDLVCLHSENLLPQIGKIQNIVSAGKAVRS